MDRFRAARSNRRRRRLRGESLERQLPWPLPALPGPFGVVRRAAPAGARAGRPRASLPPPENALVPPLCTGHRPRFQVDKIVEQRFSNIG